MKKNSGNISAGTSSAGLVKKLWRLRQATAERDASGCGDAHVRTSLAAALATASAQEDRPSDRRATPNAERQRLAVPAAMNRLRTPSSR